MLFSIFIFLVVGLSGSCLAADTCDLTFSKDFPEHPPLILSNDNQTLVLPQKDGNFEGVRLKKGDKILLSCAGDDNQFEDNKVNGNIPSAVLECSGDNRLTINNNAFTFKNLGCKNRAHAIIQLLNKDCANKKAILLEIGFETTISSSKTIWTSLITTCFDPKKSVTYYSSHEISGKGLLASQDSGNRPDFTVGLKNELYPDFSPANVYQQKEQLETFTEILGDASLASELLSESYLSKGHLAPDADFFYEVTAEATYFYVNVAPQWQDINGGMWSSLETHIRNLAKSTQLNYKIHTGTHGILTLSDVNNNQQQVFLYLDKNELPAPEFYWKVVEEPTSKKGVAFVSHNKIPDVLKIDWPCDDICEESGWDLDSSENEVICCDVNDLQEKITDFPDVNVNGILQGVNRAYNQGFVNGL